MESTAAIAAAGPDAASAAHDAFLKTRTFGSLDGLRAISIVVVVWHHTHAGIPGWPITTRGFLGVDLFFVISGFLIVTLLLRERRRPGGISLRNFYIRRFLRIFPPYYLMLALVGTLAFLRSGSEAAAIRRELPWSLLYVANLVPMTSLLAITWSLAVEEQFYLLIPGLERFARRALPALLPVAYLLSCLPPLGLFPGAAIPAFFREATFGPILLGVMLAHVLDDPRGHRLVSRLVGHPAAPAAALALVLAATSVPVRDISGWPRIGIQWSLLLLVASCVVRERHVLSGALSLWPMRRIGAVSYGIYLYHLLVRHAVVAAMGLAGLASHLLLFVATVLGTWAVAEASYRWIESRFLALKSRWT